MIAGKIMKKPNLIQLFAIAAFSALLSTSLVFAGSRSHRKPQLTNGVLPRIAKYKAPPFPKSLYIDRETYDYRVQSHTPVPATPTDVFICDIWQRVTMDLKLTMKPEEVTEEVIEQAMGIYLKRDHSQIAGYRPWTYWNFIRKLNEPQRKTLAGEIVAYIKKNGVRDVEQ